MSDNRAWSGKTGGTRWMQQSLISIFRHVNPKYLYPVVWVWICFYIVFGTTERQGIWYYWRTVQGKSRLSAAMNLYISFLEFGKAILDRFAAYAGRKVSFETDGYEDMVRLQKGLSGFIVLSSHIGNQELAGYTFKALKPMYVLAYMGDTATVNENRERMLGQMGLHLIPLQSDGSHVIDMHNVLSDGNILSIHADRLFFNSKTMCASILGHEADYPEGPFRVASAERVPVVSIFMMREGCGKYRVFVKVLSEGCYPENISSRVIARQLLQRYIEANEEMIRLYPRQWFHFYQFWKNK